MKRIKKMDNVEDDYPNIENVLLRRSIYNHLIYTVGRDPRSATRRDWFNATAHAVRNLLMERWIETRRKYYEHDVKRVYYFSLEFLMGRSLSNGLHNILAYDEFRNVLEQMDQDMQELESIEDDAALGNGGLGRLAACFLDSMATLQMPGFGYGIRYEYGMFTQRIEKGEQVEHPENWLRYGNPWEFPRPDVLFPVQFCGHVVRFHDSKGRLQYRWEGGEEVMAMAYDVPVPGYGTDIVNNLRLWAAKATRDFELKYFNAGDYIRAVEEKNESETLSRVLYPSDITEMGRALRLKQQYFFVSASLQDIIKRYEADHNGFDQLPDKVAIQLNDTHPSIAIPELMHILLDKRGMDWEPSWDICSRVFSYTNHTLMPEALETWSVSLMEKMLPRHMQIIYEINHRLLKQIAHRYPGDAARLRRMSIIDEAGGKRVRMAHLAIVGSHKVNGVASLHTALMKKTIFADFYRMFPDRFINLTNGITPRRWLNQANKALSALISDYIGNGWITELDQLKQIIPCADDPEFRHSFREIKSSNKKVLADLIQKRVNIKVNVDSLFDVHIKRIHEYKRQLLSLLHVITRYNRIRENPDIDIVPRTMIYAGKAAPSYYMAKLIINLINEVADTINNDPVVGDRLKVIFIPNYNVSMAEIIIPASDLSEQISTAGTEASGTGNMKLALNGALTIGTLDGANVEILEEVGKDNIFIFGHTTEEVEELRTQGYDPMKYYNANAELRQVLMMINSGYFLQEQPDKFKPIVQSLTKGGDKYMLCADYASYIDTQDKVDALYREQERWTSKAIHNVASVGKFSSDRTIRDYMEKVWHVLPMRN